MMPQWSGQVAACIAQSCSGSDVALATALAISLCSKVGANTWMMPASLSTALSSAAHGFEMTLTVASTLAGSSGSSQSGSVTTQTPSTLSVDSTSASSGSSGSSSSSGSSGSSASSAAPSSSASSASSASSTLAAASSSTQGSSANGAMQKSAGVLGALLAAALILVN